jgi:hydroxymethylpyrimidine/phosphomethylpyrimidine kinase
VTVANILAIAGSDPSGGAGVQADLKTMSALGAYGMAVVTALTAQSTRGVAAVEGVSPAMVTAQIDTLFADVRVDAVKIGMLADAEVAAAVAAALRRWRPSLVVLDPVMVATSGDRLLEPAAIEVVRAELAPLADLVTPNAGEAALLAGVTPPEDLGGLRRLACDLSGQLGTRVLVKGGHLAGPDSVDVLGVPGAPVGTGVVEREVSAPRVATTSTHGTGCTLSSAIATLVPSSASWAEAVTAAKAYLTGALRGAGHLEVGHGAGPVHHFWSTWPSG